LAHAFTPGLKVSEKAVIYKERRLPLKGEVVVKIGDKVKADDIVAKTAIPGDVETLNIAGRLGVSPEDVKEFLKVKVGQEVNKDDVIAETNGFFGLFKTVIKSPITGSIENISEITGQMILRHPPKPIEIDAYIDGYVTEIIENEGVKVQTKGTFVQGIFGIGGEARGEIMRIAKSNDSVITENDITSNCKGKVLIAGAFIDVKTLRKAVSVGAKGIVVGGIDDRDIKEFLGYDIGVAITGSEKKGITLIVTEGFGQMSMAKRTFEILSSHEGEVASINGATQIRAGVLRPEVIIPNFNLKDEDLSSVDSSSGIKVGHNVRIIRAPYFGLIGKVTKLPPELEKIETEAKVRILEVELNDGRKITLPRANIELIEE